jgi:hypothetical protein
MLKLIRKVVPVSNELHDGKMFVLIRGALTATPWFVALVAMAVADWVKIPVLASPRR